MVDHWAQYPETIAAKLALLEFSTVTSERLRLEAIIRGEVDFAPSVTFVGQRFFAGQVVDDSYHNIKIEGEALAAALQILKRNAEAELAQLRIEAASYGIQFDA